VNGKIYANTWNKDGVAIINPKSGAIEGLIDFRGLKKQLGNPKKANVLNGIAYDAKRDKLYVTGKNWDKLFEVKIIKK
jgi:glutaminyl-peptide cyclotransferase